MPAEDVVPEKRGRGVHEDARPLAVQQVVPDLVRRGEAPAVGVVVAVYPYDPVPIVDDEHPRDGVFEVLFHDPQAPGGFREERIAEDWGEDVGGVQTAPEKWGRFYLGEGYANFSSGPSAALIPYEALADTGGYGKDGSGSSPETSGGRTTASTSRRLAASTFTTKETPEHE